MDLNQYYLHGISALDSYSSQETLSKLEKILSSGAILSRAMQGDFDTNKGMYNGIHYISLCDYSLKGSDPYCTNEYFRGYNSYTQYIKNSVSFVLKKEKIKAIKPILLSPSVFDYNLMEEARQLGNSSGDRYSDMPDEVQVKGKVSLTNFEALTIPTFHLLQGEKSITYNINMIKEELMLIRNLLNHYGYSKPIIDLDTTYEFTDDDLDSVLEKVLFQKKM